MYQQVEMLILEGIEGCEIKHILSLISGNCGEDLQ